MLFSLLLCQDGDFLCLEPDCHSQQHSLLQQMLIKMSLCPCGCSHMHNLAYLIICTVSVVSFPTIYIYMQSCFPQLWCLHIWVWSGPHQAWILLERTRQLHLLLFSLTSVYLSVFLVTVLFFFFFFWPLLFLFLNVLNFTSGLIWVGQMFFVSVGNHISPE